MSAWFDRNRDKYPPDWTAIATRAKEDVGWICEACENPHGPPPYVLTVHHLNHQPMDCRPVNLLICCQRCHLRCQGMKPRPETREDAIRRLRARYEMENAQTTLPLEMPV